MKEKIVVFKGEGIKKVAYGPYFVQVEQGDKKELLGQSYAIKKFGHYLSYFEPTLQEPIMMDIDEETISGRTLCGKLRSSAKKIGAKSTKRAICDKLVKEAKKLDW